MTYYEGGEPLYWRNELIVESYFIQFDVDYLNKKTNERTHVKKYLVSESVEGLDFAGYTAAAKDIEEVAPPVSEYSVGQIRILNKETTVTDNRFVYDPSDDMYSEELDVEILFDIRCIAGAETQVTLIDYLNGITGGMYNTITLMIAVIGLIFTFVQLWKRHSVQQET